MPISDFFMFLLVKINEIFGLDEFLELGSDFSSIYCFFLRTRLIKNKFIFYLADYTFSSVVFIFLATLFSNFC